MSKKPGKVVDARFLRGYCRVCNRYFLCKGDINPEHTQARSHYVGVCMRCRHRCSKVKTTVR